VATLPKSIKNKINKGKEFKLYIFGIIYDTTPEGFYGVEIIYPQEVDYKIIDGNYGKNKLILIPKQNKANIEVMKDEIPEHMLGYYHIKMFYSMEEAEKYAYTQLKPQYESTENYKKYFLKIKKKYYC